MGKKGVAETVKVFEAACEAWVCMTEMLDAFRYKLSTNPVSAR